MKKLIEKRLSLKGIIPANHLSTEFSSEELIRKARRRGSHAQPSVFQQTEDGTDEEEDEAGTDEEEDEENCNASHLSDHNNSYDMFASSLPPSP